MAKIASFFLAFAAIWTVRINANSEINASYEFTTNLGRTVLAKVDLIVSGTISDTESKQGSLFQRDLTLESSHFGETREKKLVVIYTDQACFASVDGKIALALKKVQGSTTRFSIFGKPMPAKDDDALNALKDYIAIEDPEKDGDERTNLLYSTILKHLKQGGSAAKLAAVELLFLGQNHAQASTHARYEELAALLPAMTNDRVRKDVSTSLKGMVITTLKAATFVELLRAKDDNEKSTALEHLERYVKDHADAFDASDAERCEITASNLDGKELERLDAVKKAIEDAVKVRAASAQSDTPADTVPESETPKPEETSPENPFAAPKRG